MDWQNVSPKVNKNNLKLHKSRGISTIVGGIIFLVLLTSGFSSFYIALDVQKDTINTQREISKDIVQKIQEQFSISTSTDPDNNLLGIQVENQGQNPIEISNIWIINKSAIETPPYSAVSIDVNYDDAFIPAGYDAPILKKTPLYMSPGEYDIKVVSVLGTIVTEKEFDPSGAGGAILTGSIVMDFTTFEFCEPALDDCFSNSTDWATAWDGKKHTAYIWRINLANKGTEDIIVEQHTALLMLRAQTQGGGNLPRVFYMLNDTTTSNEGPIAYTDHSKIIPKDSTPIVFYFGATAVGGATLELTHDNVAIIAVDVLTFGHKDENNNGSYDNPGDPPYSQKLAFQAIRLL